MTYCSGMLSQHTRVPSCRTASRHAPRSRPGCLSSASWFSTDGRSPSAGSRTPSSAARTSATPPTGAQAHSVVQYRSCRWLGPAPIPRARLTWPVSPARRRQSRSGGRRPRERRSRRRDARPFAPAARRGSRGSVQWPHELGPQRAAGAGPGPSRSRDTTPRERAGCQGHTPRRAGVVRLEVAEIRTHRTRGGSTTTGRRRRLPF